MTFFGEQIQLFMEAHLHRLLL